MKPCKSTVTESDELSQLLQDKNYSKMNNSQLLWASLETHVYTVAHAVQQMHMPKHNGHHMSGVIQTEKVEVSQLSQLYKVQALQLHKNN